MRKKNTPLPPPPPNFPIQFQNCICGIKEKIMGKMWKSFDGARARPQAGDALSGGDAGWFYPDLLHQLRVFFIILCRGYLDPAFLGTRAA